MALLCEALRAVAGLKAPVQADFAASLGQLVQDRHRRRGLRSVREVSRPHGSEGRRPAKHEPGRDDAVVPLVVEHAAHGLPHRVDLVRALRRSEEHTSELQSLRHLVCRLLLEKKKKNKKTKMNNTRIHM